ncbi:MAG: CHAT domain-containing protein [Bacteroidota bacterium]
MIEFINHPGFSPLRRVWVILLFTSCTLFSQTSEENLNSIIKMELSDEQKVLKIDSLLLSQEAKKDSTLHYLYQTYAYWLSYAKGNKEAIVYEKKAFDFALNAEKPKNSFAQRSGTYLAYYYSRDKQILKSIEVYNDVILIDKNSKHAITAYRNLGYAYLNIQDYYKAIEYFELAITLLMKDFEKPRNRQSLREAYQNIAATCVKIRTEEAIQKGRYFGMKADSIARIIPTSDDNLYKINYALAQLHNREEAFDFDRSLHYYDRALEIVQKSKDSLKLATIHLGHGILHKDIDPDRSILSLEKALQFTRAKDSFMRYQIYTSLGYDYDQKKQHKKSLSLRHEALAYLSGTDFRDMEAIPENLFISSQRKTNLLYALPRLAETYLNQYEIEKDPHLLDKSLAYFEMADHLIDLLKINSDAYRSRLFWRELSSKVYSKAIRACFLSNNKEKAFFYMEKNKALLLMEDMAQQEFKRSLKIPRAVLKREKELEQQIYRYESSLRTIEGKSASLEDSIKKQVIDLKIELSESRDGIQGLDKALELEVNLLSLHELKKTLKSEEVILEYHISIDDRFGIFKGTDSGYLLYITRDEVELIEIENLSKLKVDVHNLITAQKSPFKSDQEIETYTKLSYQVYQKLLPKESIQQMVKNKSLIVVPDNFLSLLPFEALSTSGTTTKYLIQDAEVRYLYSNSFLFQTKMPARQKPSYIGFAPISFEETALSPLLNSKSEVEALGNYYKGMAYYQGQATKENFLEALEDPSIIHLATHADAQDVSTPWVAFHDDKLTLEELYLTRNHASLVVLSGCNTTLGKQEVGEGVMSLARGFFYGGAQSVMSTLWSIDDKSTALITREFYKNLDKGQRKSESLRNAKLTYLNTHNLSEASPHYWASFVFLGEDGTIDQGLNFKLWHGGILSLGALVIFGIFYFRRKKSVSKG